jgi:hypothetical protein
MASEFKEASSGAKPMASRPLSIKVWLCLLFSVAFCSHQLACVNDLAQGDESLYKPQLSFSARAVPIMRVTENRPDNLYQGDRVV